MRRIRGMSPYTRRDVERLLRPFLLPKSVFECDFHAPFHDIDLSCCLCAFSVRTLACLLILIALRALFLGVCPLRPFVQIWFLTTLEERCVPPRCSFERGEWSFCLLHWVDIVQLVVLRPEGWNISARRTILLPRGVRHRVFENAAHDVVA